MRLAPPSSLCESRFKRGFTLIEIVIVLTILAVLAAAAIPSLKGLQSAEMARKPLAELQRLAKDARLRAMKEKRPYQIALTSTGFTASRYFDPYLSYAELTEFNTAVEAGLPLAVASPTMQADNTPGLQLATGSAQPKEPGSPSAPQPAAPKEWTETYKLPEGTTLAVQFWHDSVPTPIAGEVLKLWVFQPSGMCEPLKIQLSHEKADLSADFSALTADIVHEKADVH